MTACTTRGNGPATIVTVKWAPIAYRTPVVIIALIGHQASTVMAEITNKNCYKSINQNFSLVANLSILIVYLRHFLFWNKVNIVINNAFIVSLFKQSYLLIIFRMI